MARSLTKPSRELPGLRDLHIAPTALEEVVSAVADGGREAQG